MDDHGFPPLATQRLRLRRLTDADLEPFLAYRNDPLVARYQSWESWSEAEGRDLFAVQRTLIPGIPGAWFQVAIALLTTEELIGDCAFCVSSDDPGQAEIGFTLARTYQGQGLAFEAVSRLLSYLFTALDLQLLCARTDAENHAAHRLLHRLGFHHQHRETVWFKGAWGGEDLYVLDRPEVEG